MTRPKVAIIGLGLIGSSIGLGLGKESREFDIVGHDKSSDAASQAKKSKAVDKTEWNLISAISNADLVILALPATAIRETLQAIAGDLKPGAIVLDTASIKAPVQAWASELLPDTALFIGTNPVPIADSIGAGAARADLFQKATWAICPSPATAERAVKMAADLADRLGAQPLFLEALEHDSMLAGVEQLPAVISMALSTAMVSQPVWRESRRLAAAQFESSTRLVSDDPHIFGDAVLANREQVTRWIDSFIDAMASWREAIAAGDQEAIDQAFKSAMAERARWLKDRRNGRWEEDDTTPTTQANPIARLFLGKLAERRPQDKSKK
jgi:prephenate dehydrogenase